MEHKFSKMVPISQGTYYISAWYYLTYFIHLIGSNNCSVDRKALHVKQEVKTPRLEYNNATSIAL